MGEFGRELTKARPSAVVKMRNIETRTKAIFSLIFFLYVLVLKVTLAELEAKVILKSLVQFPTVFKSLIRHWAGSIKFWMVRNLVFWTGDRLSPVSHSHGHCASLVLHG